MRKLVCSTPHFSFPSAHKKPKQLEVLAHDKHSQLFAPYMYGVYSKCGSASWVFVYGSVSVGFYANFPSSFIAALLHFLFLLYCMLASNLPNT